ncbi:response regulator transcription factor [Janthinobacterium psychrotolerans]|uniref:Two-component system, OmpR family, response regulator n=1 Tax=Janthinobacterium psychrotolerans TaxID=1747903 RepID=A0A1A7BZS2_9BURK|nr:response regulator transcription factor [Janthinobacterium psychrotolerans]OBV37965.1 two-component system, OmpR family, response regulator [Janthinobacterium psychrotolerans]
MRLLLVEDDPMIGESLVDGLRGESYAVDWVRDGREAGLALDGFDYDLMLLDLGLPGLQGMDVLRAARQRGADLPVLIITARDGTPARVAGLDAGADDYLVKPFDLDELLARLRALLRRRGGRTRSVIEHGGLILDLASHEATFDGVPVKLARREFSVLRALLDQPGKVITKSQFEEKLYGWDSEVESNTVDVYIYQLRKKFGAQFIQTVRGVGYKIRVAP